MDRSQALNAWGMGLTQAALDRVKNDQSVVALALQEAWFCGSPQNVNTVVGFKTASSDKNGTAFLARYGLSGAMKYLDIKGNQWLIGGDVCLDPACTATIPMYSVHFDGSAEEGIPNQAQRVIDILGAQSGPRLFMGDLNVFKVDTWNPKVACTGAHHQHDRERGLYRRVEGDAELGRLDGDAEQERMRQSVWESVQAHRLRALERDAHAVDRPIRPRGTGR
jgi:hypothetical protein